LVTQERQLDDERLRALHPALECLLFVAAEPVAPAVVAQAMSLEPEAAEEALEHLRRHYVNGGGLQVVRLAGGYQLRTRPEFGSLIATFLRPAAQKLSRQALETLAIVAYEQPITQPEIDALRGVNSDGVIRTLLDRDLVCEAGRKDAPGRPILYRTTDRFLEHFGLADLHDLPRLEDTFDAPPEKQELAI
jgi:segregation and condensation protein B